MPMNGISRQRRMAWCFWYLILIYIDLIHAQNPFDGGGFLVDPFLELTGGGMTTPVNSKTNRTDSSCISNGTLAGSIIATILLSALIAFLTWMVYLRQKLHDLRDYENRWKKQHRRPSSPASHRVNTSLSKQHKLPHTKDDMQGHHLPLDVTDCKFGTFPFRHSQIQNANGHCHSSNWFDRVPSSFRSATTDQDTQTIDIELLNPTFCGLNFSITGNMRAGIFVKDILDQEAAAGQVKLNSSDQLRTGDRIIALTVCFESIVYEDALTILSYASPYPVILRVQRPIHSSQANIIKEKRPISTAKVKWRDDFEHYDNDTPYNRSVVQPDSSKTLITELKSTTHPHPSSKKSHPDQSRSSKTSSMIKGNKSKSKYSNHLPKKKHLIKIHKPMIVPSTGLSSKPIETFSPTKTPKKSVTNAVISYLHYRGSNGSKPRTDKANNPELTMPYYDSPYDYYGGQNSQSPLNKNNNNNNSSSSIESLTPIKSIYTLQLSSTQPNLPTRRCERRISSPAAILPTTDLSKTNEKNTSLENIDTFV